MINYYCITPKFNISKVSAQARTLWYSLRIRSSTNPMGPPVFPQLLTTTTIVFPMPISPEPPCYSLPTAIAPLPTAVPSCNRLIIEKL